MTVYEDISGFSMSRLIGRVRMFENGIVPHQTLFLTRTMRNRNAPRPLFPGELERCEN